MLNKTHPSSTVARTVSPMCLSSSSTGDAFITNKISTTKYSLLSYLPHTLLLQFTKYANCFYLVSAILQSIPSISTNDPLATVIPLAYVIILGIIKEGLADWKRYKSDREVNNYPVTRMVFD